MWSDLGAVTGELADDSSNVVDLIERKYKVRLKLSEQNSNKRLLMTQNVLPSRALNHSLSSHVQLIKINSSGLEVNISLHLQSLASKIFSTNKLMRPLANSSQMFGRHG